MCGLRKFGKHAVWEDDGRIFAKKKVLRAPFKARDAACRFARFARYSRFSRSGWRCGPGIPRPGETGSQVWLARVDVAEAAERSVQSSKLLFETAIFPKAYQIWHGEVERQLAQGPT